MGISKDGHRTHLQPLSTTDAAVCEDGQGLSAPPIRIVNSSLWWVSKEPCKRLRFKKIKAPKFRKKMHQRQCKSCFYCGCRISIQKPYKYPRATADHFIPKSMFPKRSNRWHAKHGNIVLACHDCNHEKADRLPTSLEKRNYSVLFGTDAPTLNSIAAVIWEENVQDRCFFDNEPWADGERRRDQ